MRRKIIKGLSYARTTETPAVVSCDKSDRDEATGTHEGHENDHNFQPLWLKPAREVKV